MELKDDYIGQWFNAIGVKQNYRTMQYFAGDGNASRTFEFNFEGGYISRNDVKAFAVNDDSRERIDYVLTFIGPNSVTLSAVVPVGWTVLIYRDTPKARPLAKFVDGAVISAYNLDRNAQQAVFAVAEMVDRFDSVVSDVESALVQVYESNLKADEALTISNTALTNSDTAIVTADAAAAGTVEANLKSDNAVLTANEAKATAEGIEGKADQAIATANNAKSTVDTANSTADAAKVIAEGIEAKADGAVVTANAAMTVSEAATALANEAKTTANAIDGKAQDALDKANQAQQDVDTAVGGKVSKSGDTMLGPLILNADATDPKGAVTKQQLDKNGGDYLLGARWHTNRTYIPAGYASGDGQLLSRALYPNAWAAISANQVPVVTDAAWLADTSKRGCYSTGDGSTTFRIPDYNGIQPGSIKAPYFRGDGGLTDGAVQSSSLPNIKGTMMGGSAPATASGVFSLSGASSINGDAGSSFTARFGDVDFSAARYNPIYKDEVNEVRTNAVVGCYIIRLAGSYLNTGSIDAAALAASISALSARTGVLEAKSQLFTIMYPEGTPSSPYSFPVNTRRVYVNPFPGRVVKCIPEVYVNGVWGNPGWIYYYSTATAGSFGTAANQTDTLANIVVVSGTVSLSAASNTSGSPHNSNTSPTTALPLRIKVFTIDGGA